MGDFREDTTLRPAADGFAVELSRDWEIWGPNGGYLSAIALRAAGAAAPEGHRPCGYACQFLARGESGPAQVRVKARVSGRQVACFDVELSQGERVLLTASVWTTSRVEGPILRRDRSPRLPRPDVAANAHAPSYKARFLSNFDIPKPTPEATGARRGRHRRWFRYRGFDAMGDAYLSAARVLPLIDTAVWPAFAATQLVQPDYTAASLDLTVHFHGPAESEDWLLVDARPDIATGGLICGSVRVWAGGRLIATGTSQMLHIPPR